MRHLEYTKLSQKPIFVVGFPRSGTTFLQSLICSQSILSFPETHYFNKIVPQKRVLVSAQEISNIVDSTKKWFGLGISTETEKYISNLAELEQLTKKSLFEIIIKEYFFSKHIKFNENTLWLEKTPSHCFRLNEIYSYYPEAKFVAIVRNPTSCIFSYYSNLVRYRKPFPELAKLWKTTNNSIRQFQKQHESSVQIIKYEDLIENTEQEMSNLFNFLGLEYDPSLLGNYQEVSKNFILPSETWKSKNVREIKKDTISSQSAIPFLDEIKIQIVLETEFRFYGYKLHNKVLLTSARILIWVRQFLKKTFQLW